MKYTIFFYDSDTCQSHALHVESDHLTADEVWMHIFRKGLNRPDLTVDDLEDVRDEYGDDLMDYSFTGVIEGHHNDIYDTLQAPTF